MQDIISNAVDVIVNKYADFEGRARRKEYWYFALALFVVQFVLSLFTKIDFIGWLFTTVLSLIGLAMLVPSIALGVRRLHDIGKSGWWLFIALIPFVGSIWLLVLFCTDSQSGENEYGPNPKDIKV